MRLFCSQSGTDLGFELIHQIIVVEALLLANTVLVETTHPAAAGQAEIRDQGFTRSVDHTTDDRHVHRRGHVFEALLEGVAETTLLVVPQLRLGFEDLLDISELAEDLLEQQGLGGEIQLVAFHPDYVFADGDGPDDPANATNRSPFPTLHLLVAAEVEAVIQDHPDIASIPTRNVALLRRLAEESDAP